MQRLVTYRSAVNDRLEAFFVAALSAAHQPELRELTAHLQTLVSRGGKRLRPYLAYLGYSIYGGKGIARIVTVGAAIELVHAFLLIHDDIIDQDTIRYGGQNLTGTYLPILQEQGLPTEKARQQADSVALLGGDLALLYANQLLLQARLPAEQVLALQSLLFDIICTTIAGELSDLKMAWPETNPNLQTVLDMYALKTARYSVTGPLQTGAVLAGATEKELQLLQAFAQPLGIAYQLQDDLLGIFGDESLTGKSNLSDAREGKPTPLYLLAREKASGPQHQTLDQYYGNPKLTASDVSVIQQLFRETGALAASESLILKYAQQSEHATLALHIDTVDKAALTRVAKQLLSRKS